MKKQPVSESKRCEATLNFPAHLPPPEDLLNFVYLDEFNEDWNALGLDDENDLNRWTLEICIMCNPKASPVIRGTGGLRKLRFSRENEGKSGGIRVCYAYFEDFHIVLVVMAYGKNQQDNLSKQEKNGIKEYLELTHRMLKDKSGESND